ncbi:MAG: non-heme iron oxygenase ferredoxin subunit [Chloroflexota bacterium]|nr:MAG: non-heme iron oxygenase ferredoxin subunit [Chloroflexota bacterium]
MTTFVPVYPEADLPSGAAALVTVDERAIALFNVNGQLFAVSDTCTHDEASLAEGEVFGCVVECPLHGARFDLRTGRALSLPAVYPVASFPVRVSDGMVEVEI